MFSLDQAITEWRRQMLDAGIKTPVPLDELESHLRDDMEHPMRAGLSEQQAFEAAVQRIGQAKVLEAEFAKTTELKDTRERKLKLLCIVFSAVAYLAPIALSAPKHWNGMNVTEQWLGLVAVALTVSSMFSGLYLHRFLPIILDKRIRTRVQLAVFLPVLAWLWVFAYGILPRVELTIDQTTVATLWAMSPLAVFGGLAFGLDEAARRMTSAVSPVTPPHENCDTAIG